MGVQNSDLNLFKSKLEDKLGRLASKGQAEDVNVRQMAQKFSNRLSQLRSNFLFKASKRQGQSKVNFTRKGTGKSSELSFSKYKRKPSEYSQNKIVKKKTNFSKGANTMASQSSKIYSYESIPELNRLSSSKKTSFQKTTELLKEIEDIGESPKDSKDTQDQSEKKNPSKEFFKKISVFNSKPNKTSKKIQPVNFDEDSFNGFD